MKSDLEAYSTVLSNKAKVKFANYMNYFSLPTADQIRATAHVYEAEKVSLCDLYRSSLGNVSYAHKLGVQHSFSL